MTQLVWDDTGKRFYETGVDRCVLYLMEGNGEYPLGIPWNGLVSLTESPSGAEPTPLYGDNVKYLTLSSIEQFAATLEAYTYPEEFDECDGSKEIMVDTGGRVSQQPRKKFGLVYRTKLGNDVAGQDLGYKLHLLYGCLASPSEKAYATINDSPEAITFSWEISTTPINVTGFQPTSLITIDSTQCSVQGLSRLEDQLFGSAGITANLPLPDAVKTIFETAHNWYVDSLDGNDNKDGRSEATAWKTSAKVNASTFLPEDYILFKCGGRFRGQVLSVPSSGTAGKPITFATYGMGANPILDPTTRFTNFVLHAGAVWKRTDVGNDPTQVWEDEIRLIYKTSVATMVSGSWCKTGGEVYVQCTDDGNPNTEHVVEYAIGANSITIRMNGKSHLVFDGIDAYRSNYTAYNTDLPGSSDIVIRNSVSSWTGGRSFLVGVSVIGTSVYPSDVIVKDCVAHDDLDESYWIGHGTRLFIEHNEAYNSGKDTFPNGKQYPEATHFPGGILISAEAVDCVVRRNYIHDNYKLAAILDERSLGLKGTRTIIEQNLVDTSIGAMPAIQIEGINTTVRNNLIRSGSGSPILLSNGPTIPEIYNNTLVSPSGGLHSIETGGQPGARIKNNILIRAGALNRYISVSATAQPGTVINRNLYFGAATGRWFWGPNEYTSLAAWQAASGQDANSLNSDPVFVVPNTDLHLQVTSPCIGAGEAGLVTDDYDGINRGVAIDIGAYEYAP